MSVASLGQNAANVGLVSTERLRLREQWFHRGRSVPGQVAAAARYRAYAQKLAMRPRHAGTRVSTPNNTLQATWTPLGPAPLASDASGQGQFDYGWVSGRATAVAIDPADPSGSTVYVGGAYGGVWKSQNAACGSFGNAGCVTWTPLTDNLPVCLQPPNPPVECPTLSVGAIAIQPGGNGVILVGTGEADSSADSYYGLGILRSLDGGNSWTLISSANSGARSFAGLAFSKIAFSTANPTLVVAAAAGASEGIIEGLENPITANLGLYYSRDSGASWTYANVTDGGTPIAPDSVTSVVYNSVTYQFFAAIRYHGFYFSNDGINWTRFADSSQPGTGLTTAACPANPSASSCPIYRGEMTVVPGRNEMYAWYEDLIPPLPDIDEGIYQSLNTGTTWTRLDETGIDNCGDLLGCGIENGSYNLELTAVPNGGVTDLYAGAINLYKCTVTGTPPLCGGSGSNQFINLTHAYGCSSIAKVHPAQHAAASILVDANQDVMYFANDGGIYRALNGYTGLTSGTCGEPPNSFDSLNQTLGSITQFVSFSQASGDPNVILGGTQGDGAAATAWALYAPQDCWLQNECWTSVNAGDNGHTQISPDNEDLWFVSSPPDSVSGVNVYSCASGVNCHTQDFQNDQVVSSESVGGDTGAFYPPYILDPQNSSALIVGTCRMWRGPSAGGGYALLSPNFETGGDGICSGSETNLVRSLAAGGPCPDSQCNTKLSSVIYAGTDGYGPLIPTSPEGGHVWITTNAANGPSTWVQIDQNGPNGPINPNSFPISAIAMDASDKSGGTAYVGIMGFSTPQFPTSHVWQTTNVGGSWTDFTANLPDAPVDAILVDSSTTPSAVYVGTDMGVFCSSAIVPNWIEVGSTNGSAPCPVPAQTSYLPNVSVTALAMYNDGSNKYLRASTYGRGVWQYPLMTTPGYRLITTDTPASLTMFVGQATPATYDLQADGYNQYSGHVTLSCIPGQTTAPPTCQPSQTSVQLTPQNPTADFTLAVSSTQADDYIFNLHGQGDDQNKTSFDLPLTLHVLNLTPPSPSSVTVNRPNTSQQVNFQVQAGASFDGVVNLACLGLPDGANCIFGLLNGANCIVLPSNAVSPTANNPAKVCMSISTNPDTPAGVFPLFIDASTSGAPDQKQPFQLTVTSLQDFGLKLVSTPSGYGAAVTQLATVNGALTSFNGYSSNVNLSCGAGATNPPSRCVANPASLIPSASGAAFSVAMASDVVASYNFNIIAQGTDPSNITHLASVNFAATFDFSVMPISGQQSIAAGQQATYNIDLKPVGSTSNAFPNDVAFSCSGLPTLSTCSFSPAQINKGAADTQVMFTIQTTAPVLALARPRLMVPLYALWLPLSGCILLFPKRRQRKSVSIFFLLMLALLLLTLTVACGGGGGSTSGSGSPGTNPGQYTVTINANCGSLNRSAPVLLIVN